MLNKLLKKCMPWMDKGRWYHIGIKANMVEGSIMIIDVTYDKSMFSSHDIDSDSVKLHFSNSPINATIIDVKTILHRDTPGNPFFLNLPGLLPLNLQRDDLGYYLTVPALPGTVDVWLFIKTN